jgi:transposase
MNKITTLGIDLAKNVFQLHGVDVAGKVVLCREVRRAQLMKTVAQLEPCLIGMEACGSAHYWARRFAEHGHEVKMMSPQFVKPYRKSDKNDRNDAEREVEDTHLISKQTQTYLAGSNGWSDGNLAICLAHANHSSR